MAKVGQHRDRAGNCRRQRHDQGVAVLHVRKLMRHHAGDFFFSEPRQKPGGGGDSGVFGVAAGGERVGLVLLDDIDLGHRQACIVGELAHHGDEARRGRVVDLTGAVHGQHHLVGVPIGKHVHANRDDERDQHAALAADHGAQAHEKRRHGG
jgi:hypothetical protein